MGYKKMLHKMQDDKNTKINKLCAFCLDLFVCF